MVANIMCLSADTPQAAIFIPKLVFIIGVGYMYLNFITH